MSTDSNKKEQPGTTVRCCRDAQLLAYCAAAGGALLAAQPADAAIVYSGVKNLVLTDNNTIVLDLDSNGVADFKLKNANGKSTRVVTDIATCSGTFQTTYRTYTGTQTFTSYWTTYSGATFRSTWTTRNTNTVTTTLTGTHPCQIKINVPIKNFTKNDIQPAEQGNAIAVQNENVRLGKGAAVPGQGMEWLDGAADLSFSSVIFSTNDGEPEQGATTNKAVGGPLFSRKGFLGVKFKIDDATHYGWIRYQGDNGTDNTDNATSLKATIVDWAYEKLPDTPIAIGQDISQCAALSPSRISKTASFFKPFGAILIKGDASTAFTKDTQIDWGAGGIKTLFAVPLGKTTMLAVVRIKPSLLKSGDTYEVTVGECRASLTVGL